jgi:hypothetical protein
MSLVDQVRPKSKEPELPGWLQPLAGNSDATVKAYFHSWRIGILPQDEQVDTVCNAMKWSAKKAADWRWQIINEFPLPPIRLSKEARARIHTEDVLFAVSYPDISNQPPEQVAFKWMMVKRGLIQGDLPRSIQSVAAELGKGNVPKSEEVLQQLMDGLSATRAEREVFFKAYLKPHGWKSKVQPGSLKELQWDYNQLISGYCEPRYMRHERSDSATEQYTDTKRDKPEDNPAFNYGLPSKVDLFLKMSEAQLDSVFDSMQGRVQNVRVCNEMRRDLMNFWRDHRQMRQVHQQTQHTR